MKIKILIFNLIFFVACGGYTKFLDREITMFKSYSQDEVWQAWIDVLSDRKFVIGMADRDSKLIQATKFVPVPKAYERDIFKWSLKLYDSNNFVKLDIQLRLYSWFIGYSGNDYVKGLFTDVREKLELENVKD